MKAIIVPGITDLNKGDQALVWESHRLVNDLKTFDEIFILSDGGTEEERDLLSSQTKERGYTLLPSILKHPRRGKHSSKEHVKESKSSYIRLIKNGVLDFTKNSSIISLSKHHFLCNIFLDEELNQTIDAFRECDVIFVKGGGFLHAHGEFFAPYLIWYFLYYLRLGKKLGKKVIILPNSFGPFDGLTVKNQITNVLKECDLVYARENVSAEALFKATGNTVNVRPDLGFYLKPSGDIQYIDSIMQKYNLKNEDNIVGITVRPWRFPGHNNPEELYQHYIQAIAEFASYVTTQGYKVVVCNQSIGPNSHEDDRNAIKDLLEISHDITWINENLHCDVLKGLYSRFYCFLGTRFHSIIFSLTSSIPSIAIGYGGNKARGIMSEFNLVNYVIPINLVQAEALISCFNEIENNYDNIKTLLSKGVMKIEADRELMINEIHNVIKS